MLGSAKSSILNWANLDRARLRKFLSYLSLLFVCLGTAIRLIQYIQNRSLWFDEVNLALNIVNRSYLELAQTLDHNQAAPLGFLWVEKLSVQIFGNSEYALRLFPLVSNLVALGVFYRLLTRYAVPAAVPIAIALFAFGRHTLYFATELKQYSSDLAITLILFWFLVKAGHKLLGFREILGYGLLGSLAVWFSHPAIFMLGGIEGYYLLTASNKQQLKILANRIWVYLAWLASFGIFYWLTIASTIKNDDLANSWSARYPDSWLDLGWLFDALGRFFYNPLGFTGITDGIGIFAFVFGCIALYRRNRALLGVLMAPFGATLLAAYLHQYPFRERLVLFLVPWAIMIMAEGIVWLLSKFYTASGDRHKIKYLAGCLGTICLIALTITPMARATSFVLEPELKHEIRPVTEYVVSQQQPGDKIYVYSLGAQGFSYYVERLGYGKSNYKLDYTLGLGNLAHKDKEAAQNWQELEADLKPLQGESRVWLVLRAEIPEKNAVLQYFNQIGQQISVYEQPGAAAYLYDLSEND